MVAQSPAPGSIPLRELRVCVSCPLPQTRSTGGRLGGDKSGHAVGQAVPPSPAPSSAAPRRSEHNGPTAGHPSRLPTPRWHPRHGVRPPCPSARPSVRPCVLLFPERTRRSLVRADPARPGGDCWPQRGSRGARRCGAALGCAHSPMLPTLRSAALFAGDQQAAAAHRPLFCDQGTGKRQTHADAQRVRPGRRG